MISKIKRFFIFLVTFIVTITILYMIGMKFDISILVFHHRYKDYDTGSLLPYLIAVLFSIFVDKRYVSKRSS
ncbi:hypothetical protein FB550_13310 [Neobacillus bataviensis]|uniref:Uncharacterized protein n=1 Tax=Neobacillus bataviensis TaxID=220685 RepID=A0A561CA74_9BACI|nr:hypothetical protein FB550_13310 [Neobacillus bataviensis]